MANYTVATTPILGLIRELRDEVKNLLKQEMNLAKTEVSEKASKFGKNAGFLAAGGLVACMGLLLFLIGLGFLVAHFLEQAGVAPMVANFIGVGGIGFLIILTGLVFVLKAMKTFKRESMKPERTVQTIQQFRGTDLAETKVSTEPEPEAKPKPSSQQLQSDVSVTQNMLGERMEELSRRMTPQYVNLVVKGQVRGHPTRSMLVAFGTGLASAIMLMRRMRHARA